MGRSQKKKKKHSASLSASQKKKKRGWTQQDYQRAEQEEIRNEQQQTSQTQDGGMSEGEDGDAAAVAESHLKHRSKKKKRQHTPAWMREPEDIYREAQQQQQLQRQQSSGASSEVSILEGSSSSSSMLAPPPSLTMTSTCWNQLPRDCLLHIFSFHDFFTLTRLTCISHFWYTCLKKGGLNARVLEASWRILKQKKATQPIGAYPIARTSSTDTAPMMDDENGELLESQSTTVQLHQIKPLSEVISPLFIDPSTLSATNSSTSSSPLPLDASPSVSSLLLSSTYSPNLSSLPPSSALKSITNLQLSGPTFTATAASISQPHTPFSSSSSLFKASISHLDSLYLGQKQLRYSLHSNPLFQHLWIIYHVSLVHEKLLEGIRDVHVLLYRQIHQGKFPRSTKIDEEDNSSSSSEQKQIAAAIRESAMAIANTASSSSSSSSSDLMPLQQLLDACMHQRSSFLQVLEQSHKHLYTFLHVHPPHICYGFTGNCLPLVQLSQTMRGLQTKLEASLKAQRKIPNQNRLQKNLQQQLLVKKQQIRKRLQLSLQQQQQESISSVLTTSEPCVENEAELYLTSSLPSAPNASGSGLFDSTHASQIHQIIRRINDVVRIWSVYLAANPPTSNGSQDDAEYEPQLAANEKRKSLTRSVYLSSSATAPAALSSSSVPYSVVDRSWDALAAVWQKQHARLNQLESFWNQFTQLLQQQERKALVSQIVHRAGQKSGNVATMSQESVPSDI